MKVCQGLKIIMVTRMDNMGALLCDRAAVLFQDSRENQLDEDFISSHMATYNEVQEAVRAAQLEDDMMDVVENIEGHIPLDESSLDPHIEEYIGGWIERKVFHISEEKL